MSDFRRDEMTDSEVDESRTPKRKCVERIDMIRKSEYDELVREHLETRAEMFDLENQLTILQAKLKAVETALAKANSQETALYVENGRMRVLLSKAASMVDAAYGLFEDREDNDECQKIVKAIDDEIGQPK